MSSLENTQSTNVSSDHDEIIEVNNNEVNNNEVNNNEVNNNEVEVDCKNLIVNKNEVNNEKVEVDDKELNDVLTQLNKTAKEREECIQLVKKAVEAIEAEREHERRMAEFEAMVVALTADDDEDIDAETGEVFHID